MYDPDDVMIEMKNLEEARSSKKGMQDKEDTIIGPNIIIFN